MVRFSEGYGDQAEFIVIEPFDLLQAREGGLVPMRTRAELVLVIEPSVFITAADGRVAGKVQRIASGAEVGAALEQVLAGWPSKRTRTPA